GQILAGGDRFRHSNELDNESDIWRLKGDYVLGDHVITAGWERESKSVRNRFLPHSKALVVFNSIADLQSRTIDPFSSLYGFSNTGVASDADANFTLHNDSFFIQDTWDVNDDLILTFGLRYLRLSNDDPITENPNFASRYPGQTNTYNMDGADLLQPRIGFNWIVNDQLTLRGGAGLFGGGEPLIILSNAYSGDGISRTFAFPLAFMADQQAVADFIADLPDANAAFNNLQSQIGVDPSGTTDVIDPSYKPLSTWKYSIGAEYVFGDDWILNADLIFSQVEDGNDIEELRRQVIDTAPDGRPIYDSPGFGFGYDTTVFNTGQGDGTVFTLSLAKTFDTNYGFWDMSLGYTHQDMEELRSYNRFVTFETLVFDANTDHNNPVAGPSRFETKDRITATLSWEKELFRDNTTSVGLVYAGRTGRHFSYVFGSGGVCTFGGIAFADCGAEGDIIGNQLFYVPTGPTDPLISGDPGFLADLDEFISSEGCLAGSRGSIVTRNNCETDWVNVFSVRFLQEIKIGNTALDLMLDIENVGNLINSDWGRVDSYTAPSMAAPANVSIPVAGGPYLLTPTSSYDPAVGAASVVAPPEIASLPSVYRIQLGLRFRF
ncbi:MAG: TonB-dependent receptor, partial [Woeseiaceae bacterium]|nr:TonB-dependent receptor [Woeseiaceae bacterium]